MVILGSMLALVAIAIAGPVTAVRAQEEAPDGVVNYTRIDATVACAGATPPEAMAGLKQLGFVSVINFRTAGEQDAQVEEGKAAAAAGTEAPKTMPASATEAARGSRACATCARTRCCRSRALPWAS